MFDIYSIFEVFQSLSMLFLSIGIFLGLFFYRSERKGQVERFTLEILNQKNFQKITLLPFAFSTDYYEEIFSRDGPIALDDSNLPENILSFNEFLQVLASMELLGLSIRKGLVDEDIAYEYMGSLYAKRYHEIREVIKAMRGDDSPDSFSDLEALARRWTKRRRGK